MATFDLIGLIIIVLLGLRGLVRGFVHELLTLAAPLLGLLAAILFSKLAIPLVQPLTHSNFELLNQFISFLSIFLIVYLIAYLLQRILASGIENLNLQALDKALGLLLGLLEGLVLFFLILTVLSFLPLPELKRLVSESLAYSLAKIFLPKLET